MIVDGERFRLKSNNVGVAQRIIPERDEATYHIELLIGCGEMDRRTGAIVLSDIVRVGVHNLCQLLGVAQPDRAVKSDWRVLGNRWVPDADR